MIQLYEGGAYLVHGSELVPEREAARVEQLTGKAPDKEEARKGTIAYSILQAHNTSGSMNHLKIKFDAMRLTISPLSALSRRRRLRAWKRFRCLTC
mgnify:CR=1 FL=1